MVSLGISETAITAAGNLWNKALSTIQAYSASRASAQRLALPSPVQFLQYGRWGEAAITSLPYVAFHSLCLHLPYFFRHYFTIFKTEFPLNTSNCFILPKQILIFELVPD